MGKLGWREKGTKQLKCFQGSDYGTETYYLTQVVRKGVFVDFPCCFEVEWRVLEGS